MDGPRGQCEIRSANEGPPVPGRGVLDDDDDDVAAVVGVGPRVDVRSEEDDEEEDDGRELGEMNRSRRGGVNTVAEVDCADEDEGAFCSLGTWQAREETSRTGRSVRLRELLRSIKAALSPSASRLMPRIVSPEAEAEADDWLRSVDRPRCVLVWTDLVESRLERDVVPWWGLLPEVVPELLLDGERLDGGHRPRQFRLLAPVPTRARPAGLRPRGIRRRRRRTGGRRRIPRGEVVCHLGETPTAPGTGEGEGKGEDGREEEGLGSVGVEDCIFVFPCGRSTGAVAADDRGPAADPCEGHPDHERSLPQTSSPSRVAPATHGLDHPSTRRGPLGGRASPPEPNMIVLSRSHTRCAPRGESPIRTVPL